MLRTGEYLLIFDKLLINNIVKNTLRVIVDATHKGGKENKSK